MIFKIIKEKIELYKQSADIRKEKLRLFLDLILEIENILSAHKWSRCVRLQKIKIFKNKKVKNKNEKEKKGRESDNTHGLLLQSLTVLSVLDILIITPSDVSLSLFLFFFNLNLFINLCTFFSASLYYSSAPFFIYLK